VGAVLDLLQRLLSRNIKALVFAVVPRGRWRGPIDPPPTTAEDDGRPKSPAITCSIRVDLPMPGGPPNRIMEPGTTPPPRTRSNSAHSRRGARQGLDPDIFQVTISEENGVIARARPFPSGPARALVPRRRRSTAGIPGTGPASGGGVAALLAAESGLEFNHNNASVGSVGHPHPPSGHPLPKGRGPTPSKMLAFSL